MNNTQTNFSFLLAIAVSVIIGIISGLLFAGAPGNYLTTLYIQLITSGMILILTSIYILTRQCRAFSAMTTLKSYITFLLIGAFASFISAVLALTIIVTPATVIGAVLFGISIGFFVLMIIGVILLLGYFLASTSCQRE